MGKLDNLIVFDTTLRDGEQSPGASMTVDEKVNIAYYLERLGVDIIEAGFPVTSAGDFAAVEAIAKQIKYSKVAALSRTVKKDIEQSARALKQANYPRIHTFIATSPLHRENKLRMTKDEIIEKVRYGVTCARNYTDDVEFSAEDAARTESDFLCKVVETAIQAGASTINIPDTVGYMLPIEFGFLFRKLIEEVPNSDQVIFSCHCHNDLGLAVANSLAAVLNGARQVECTMNGIGERAGNAALEEVVMAIKTRPDVFSCTTNIKARHLLATSRLVAETINYAVQPNKAIVGKNAFAHEAGIHQDGVLKKRETYEIMCASDVGWESNQLILGKHSGRNAFKVHLEGIGVFFKDDKQLIGAFDAFKTLSDQQKRVSNEELIQLSNSFIKDDKVST